MFGGIQMFMASRSASGLEEGELGRGHGHPFVGEERTQAPWLKTSGLFPGAFGSSVPWTGQSMSLQTSAPTDAWLPSVVVPSEAIS